MSNILLISDLHGDAITGGVKRVDDVFGWLEDLDYSEFDGCIFCGDLADPDGVDVFACQERLKHFIESFENGNRAFYGISGNHDVVEDGRGSTIFGSMHSDFWTEPDVIYLDGCNIGLLPYTARAKAYDPGAQVAEWKQKGEKIGCFIGHLNIEGYGPGSETTDMPRGREVFWPLKEIAAHYPDAICIGGHYHKGEEIRFDMAGQCVFNSRAPAFQMLHIVGAPARFTFGEEKHTPSYSVLDTDTMTIERRPIPTRQVVTLRDFDTKGIQNGAIVRLQLPGLGEGTQEKLDAFAKELTEKFMATVVMTNGVKLSAPVEAVKFVAAGAVYEDPVDAARKLAEAWPAIDATAEEFRKALVGVVDDIAMEEA